MGGKYIKALFRKDPFNQFGIGNLLYKKVTSILCPYLGQMICPQVGGSSELSGERTTVSTQEPNSQTPLKSVLVISGGEGYIDFRMGKNFNFPNVFFYYYLKYYHILII